jgi:crossover junction endodeoxyribonuclease RuvC
VTRILGLDVSLTATGLAGLESTDDGWKLETDVFKTTPHPKGETRYLLNRMNMIRQHCRATASWDTLVVIEGPALAAMGSSSKDLVGLWWLVYDGVCAVARQVVVVPPSTLKKWATGKGNASKGQVAIGVHRTFPQDVFGVDFAVVDDNEADAAALCGIGAQLLGLDAPFDIPKYRTDALSGLRLPDEEAA